MRLAIYTTTVLYGGSYRTLHRQNAQLPEESSQNQKEITKESKMRTTYYPEQSWLFQGYSVSLKFCVCSCSTGSSSNWKFFKSFKVLSCLYYVIVVTWARVTCLKYMHKHNGTARVRVHIFQANHKCPCYNNIFHLGDSPTSVENCRNALRVYLYGTM